MSKAQEYQDELDRLTGEFPIPPEVVELMAVAIAEIDRLEEIEAELSGKVDTLESDVEDLKDEKPDQWQQGVLNALDAMPTNEVGPYLEIGMQHAGIEHGYTSPEFESMSMLHAAITSPVCTYK